jgi:hypothetical protein
MNEDNEKDKKPEPPKRPEPRTVTGHKDKKPSETRKIEKTEKKQGK